MKGATIENNRPPSVCFDVIALRCLRRRTVVVPLARSRYSGTATVRAVRPAATNGRISAAKLCKLNRINSIKRRCAFKCRRRTLQRRQHQIRLVSRSSADYRVECFRSSVAAGAAGIRMRTTAGAACGADAEIR